MKEIKNLKNIANVLWKLSQILFWGFIVIGIMLLVAEIVVYFVPDHYFEVTDFYEGDLIITVKGWFEYDFANEMGNSLMLKPIILVFIPAFILYIIFYLVNFKQVQVILRSVIADRPFDEKNSRSLFIMSLSFFIASFVFQIAGNLAFSMIGSELGFEGNLFSFMPDFTMLFTGLLLLILSGVFKYGNYLQDEYDETV